MNWKNILEKLASFPDGVNNLFPPCKIEQLQEIDDKILNLPATLREMLMLFNGAELFVNAIPFVTLFGTDIPTAKCNLITMNSVLQNSCGQTSSVAFAMTNYGSILILGSDDCVKEWDGQTGQFSDDNVNLSLWIDETIRDGEQYMLL